MFLKLFDRVSVIFMVHVEASVADLIILAGLILKLGGYGLFGLINNFFVYREKSLYFIHCFIFDRHSIRFLNLS